MQTISFVIPVYNEEQRLHKTFEAFRELRLPRGLKLGEVIFINDGSTDKTALEIGNWKLEIEKKLKTKLNIISYIQNKGKGYAVKTGMLASSSDYTIFFDADISTPLSEIKKFVPFMKKGVDLIVGTRKNGESTVLKHQPFMRELLGRSFTHIARLLLGLSFTDFTCGFKAFSRNAQVKIFSQTKISRWGYDAEILFLAKKLQLTTVEKAVIWSNDEHSKVKLLPAIPQTMFDLLQIYWYHNLSLLYPTLFPFGIKAKSGKIV